MGYSRKNANSGIWSFRSIKETVCGNFQGLFKNEVEFPGDQEKIMWNFQGSLFLALEFPRNLTQFCGICIAWLSFFCLEFLGGVKQKIKIQGGIQKPISSNPHTPPPPLPPRLDFFWNSSILCNLRFIKYLKEL